MPASVQHGPAGWKVAGKKPSGDDGCLVPQVFCPLTIRLPSPGVSAARRSSPDVCQPRPSVPVAYKAAPSLNEDLGSHDGLRGVVHQGPAAAREPRRRSHHGVGPDVSTPNHGVCNPPGGSTGHATSRKLPWKGHRRTPKQRRWTAPIDMPAHVMSVTLYWSVCTYHCATPHHRHLLRAAC
ncbi:hypothetical protein OH76DRAFT_1047535 [Lentinus brumalis]|uniref:Uncharacterized protein n=1 Tax=Lentinus brumalis TaxID=2498619 RepID=A0A371CWT3_9APHY|nr:hypothetical protein OH76DRAFT_1047535 [Polyporus brumalis]